MRIPDIEECVKSGRLCHDSRYHQVPETEIPEIQARLLDWYDRCQRTDMPWRKPTILNGDRQALGQRAYEVWVSEIMLQQTQVATVIHYYKRWMEAFPTIYDLASADIEQVNTLWAGLGYYSRARRLWEGARKVVESFNGILPDNAKDLQDHIPGVGRYTAGAVASIVYGQQVPVVDGNVIRVLARLQAIGADPKTAKVVDLFWEIAGQLVPNDRPGDFNQAIMELGATVCTPQNPSCSTCPLQNHCSSLMQLQTYKRLQSDGFWTAKKRRRSIEHECTVCPEIKTDLMPEDYAVTRYPAKPEKKPPRNEECAVYIVERTGSSPHESTFLISKRPKTGLLAGLWEFPSLELDLGVEEDTSYDQRAAKAAPFLKARYGIDISSCKDAIKRHDLGQVVHLFSHIRKVYHIEWIQISLPADTTTTDNRDNTIRWVDLSELKKSPIPTGLKKGLKLLENFRKQLEVGHKKKKPKTKNAQTADITTFFKRSKQL